MVKHMAKHNAYTKEKRNAHDLAQASKKVSS